MENTATMNNEQLMTYLLGIIASTPAQERPTLINKALTIVKEIRYIQEITSSQAEALIEAWVNDIEIPDGRWYVTEGEKIVAIDNQSGDCWVEEFNTVAEAMIWLIFGEE